MLPVIALAGLAGLIAWIVRPKTTGIVRAPEIAGDVVAQPQKALAASRQPPLQPEEERLLSLLVLFARDKKNPPGGKRYLSLNTAREAVGLARRFGLPKTARAIQRDDAVPTDETLPGHTASIRESVVSYGTRGRA